MSKIIDQIKNNAVPAGVMHSAAKGALPLPPAEMLEILVYLTQNSVFGQEARMTLARWDVETTIQVVSDAAAPPEVLGYFWMEGNRRPSLMPGLIENPAIPETMLMELASEERRESIRFLLASKRARSSPAVVEALQYNPALEPQELDELKAVPTATEEAAQPDPEVHAAHQLWHQEHAAEIAAEEGKPFELTGEEESQSVTTEQPAAAPSSTSLAATALRMQAEATQEDENKLTLVQKMQKLNAADRVKLAFTGNREERAILIRDGARVVQMAVIASPKLTDPEVETFASAKNVSEQVLREIARSRRFRKNYNVGRNLVNNAKCPLDLSLSLVRTLLVYDLKGLRFNKGVPDTIRQLAAKLYKEKTGPGREGSRG
jgi:hypothetical protein